MSYDLEMAVAGYLQGLLGFKLGTDLFKGPPRPTGKYMPDRRVFVCKQPGAPRSKYMGTLEHVAHYQAQIRYCGVINDYANAENEAQSIFDFLDNAKVDDCLPAFSVSGSSPHYLGEDSEGRTQFSMQFEFQRKENHQ